MHDDLASFRIGNTAEITALLAQLRDAECPIVLAAPDGASLCASLSSFDAAAGHLQLGVEEQAPQLASITAADEVLAVSHLDQVQLQFTLHGLLMVHGLHASTLKCDWPEQVLRLQRRDSFRVRPSARTTPHVQLRHPALPDMCFALRLLDVSVGGCALLLPHDVPELQPGTCVEAVRVQLDQATRFDTALLLHHVSAIGSGPRRIGCAWVGLAPDAERALQRYINDTQKRQRLLGGAA